MASEVAVHDEKLSAQQVDDLDFTKVADSEKDVATEDDDDEFTPEEKKKIIRKIDIRVTLTCGAIYCISLMDRTNLGAASIAGMTAELKLGIANRYNLIALIFFIPYIIIQFPGTVLVRVFGVRAFLGGIALLWGVVMICFGFVTVWTQLLGLRVLLGFFEAGFFPACIYLVSTWYVRYEMQQRYAMFYLVACCASALAGILAYGLMQMHGLAGKAGWRWIFIMEGILTCLIAIVSFFTLVEFPDRASKSWKFLNQREIEWVLRRVQRDRGDATLEPFSMRKFLMAGLDFKLWGLGVIFCCLTTVTYVVSFFLPIILKNQLGFSLAAAQCLTAPPYVLAGILMLASGWLGDKYHIRGPIIVFNAILSIIGLAVMTWSSSNAVRYFGVFLVTAGVNANVPTAMAYQGNNIRGQWKRAFGSATLVGFGGLGGISGSLVMRTQDAPRYLNGIYACMAANGLIILIVLMFSIYFHRENKLAKAGKKIIQDHHGFYYTL